MPRILRILNRLNIGGPTYNAVYLTRYLAPEYETLLLAGQRDDTEGDSTPFAERLGIVPETIADMHRELHPARDWRGLQQVRAVIRRYRPDIVHTHAAKAGALGRMAARLEGVPVVVHTFHGHVFHSYFSPLKTRVFITIEQALARLSSAIVAISERQRHELAEVYRIAPAEKVALVPNGFDLSRFDPNPALRAAFRQEYDLRENEIAIGIVGRLVPVKNHALFLESIAALSAQMQQPVRAFIIGDGELNDSLRRQAAELGLRSRAEAGPSGLALEWTSWLLDIERAYAGLDAVVLTSFNEGTPVSLIEAQAAGLPVISTDVGGVADVVVDGQTGRLVPSGDSGALTQALAELVSAPDQQRAWGKEGASRARAHYGVERLARDMADLYQRLLAQGRG